MNRWMIAATAVAALSLGACGEAPERNTISAENEAAEMMTNYNGVEMNVQSAIQQMPDSQRNATMMRGLLDAGLNCQGVTESEPTAPQNGLPTWRATCKGGEQHLMSLSPDGTWHTLSRPS